MFKDYITAPTAEDLDLRADLMESIENFLMSGDESIQEMANEIGMDLSQLDELFSQNTLDFSLGGLVCYVSRTGEKTNVSVQ